MPKPNVVDLLKCLPQTNCGECNCPTCLVFTCRMAEGVKSPHDCTQLADESLERLKRFMSGFKFLD